MKIATLITLASLATLSIGSISQGQMIEERNLPLQLIDDVDAASLDAGVVTRLHVVPGDRVKAGDPADFTLQLDDQPMTFPGSIVFVSPEIRFTEQTFDVWIEIEIVNGSLLPRMKGNVSIGPR